MNTVGHLEKTNSVFTSGTGEDQQQGLKRENSGFTGGNAPLKQILLYLMCL